MATIKSCTDLEQSKKLEEILPLESADMGINVFVDNTKRTLPIDDWDLVKEGSGNVKFYPAWSLTALIKVLPKCIKLSQDTLTCYKNPAYKGEKYYFNIEVCGLFNDRWFVYYCGKHERQLGKRFKQTYVNLLVSEEYENIIDACYEMVLKLHELNLL